MKSLLLWGSALLLAIPVHAQHGKRPRRTVIPAPPPPAVYRYVEQRASFSGDPAEWVSAHLRYPDQARYDGITGRAHVRFTVDTSGAVRQVAVVKSAGFFLLDSEACRVIRAMPPWKPARINGRPIASQFQMPVRFRIEP